MSGPKEGKNPLEGRSDKLKKFRTVGIAVITFCISFSMLLSEIERIRSEWPSPLIVSYAALFLLTFLISFLWIWFTQKELDILFRWLRPGRYKPPSDLMELLMIVGLGFLLSMLFYAARDPLYYSLVFTGYSLLVLFSTLHLNREIHKAVIKSREHLNQLAAADPGNREYQLLRKGIEHLSEHYLIRPHTLRHAIILMFSAIALLLAILSKGNRALWLALCSYWIMIATLVVSEIILGYWRGVLDKHLAPLEEEIEEIRDANASSKAA